MHQQLNNSNSNNSNLPKEAYIYSRISSLSSSNFYSSTSLDTQEAACVAFCKKNGITNWHTVREVSSARDMRKMKKYNRMIKEMRQSYTPCLLVVYRIDRLSRNLSQALVSLDQLQARGHKIFSVLENIGYETYIERNQFRTALSQSEYTGDEISYKVRTSYQMRKVRGDQLGAVPYGMEVYRTENNSRQFRPSSIEQNVMGYMHQLSTTDQMSNREIVDTLNEQGILNRNRLWTPSKVTKVLRIINTTGFNTITKLNRQKSRHLNISNLITNLNTVSLDNSNTASNSAPAQTAPAQTAPAQTSVISMVNTPMQVSVNNTATAATVATVATVATTTKKKAKPAFTRGRIVQ